MRLAGLSEWAMRAARGCPEEHRCGGCKRAHAVVTVLFDGEPVALCERCARTCARPLAARPRRDWLELVPARAGR